MFAERYADTIQIAPWAFAAAAVIAATLGIMLVSLYRDVTVRPHLFVYGTCVPAILALLLAGGAVPLAMAVWSVVLIVNLAALAMIDSTTQTIPDVLSMPLITLGLAHTSITGGPFFISLFSVFGIVLASALFHAIRRKPSPWIGGGDVLLVCGALSWLGAAHLFDLLVLTGMTLLLRVGLGPITHPRPAFCIPVPVARSATLPLAPSLSIALLMLWFGGPIF